MSYISQLDLENAYGEDEVLQITGGDTGILDSAIQSMESIINRNLRGLYQVPFAVLPSELIDIALAITWYILWRRNPGNPAVDERYKAAMTELKNLAKGISKLNTTEAELANENVVSSAYAETRTMIYGSSWLDKYRM